MRILTEEKLLIELKQKAFINLNIGVGSSEIPTSNPIFASSSFLLLCM